MIRKAKESDIDNILKVLSCYNFKVVKPIDGAIIDDDFKEFVPIYNNVSELNLKNGFVAVHDDKVVGFSHYKKYKDGKAKTTLIAVLPDYRKHGYGKKLQLARMKAAYKNGYKTLISFTENPYASEWYVKYFRYKVIGRERCYHRLHFIPLKNRIIWGVHYGLYDYDEIDVLECNLEEFFCDF
jgi:N-acetylglutamate synthase-like GNAT family acetyltransferase